MENADTVAGRRMRRRLYPVPPLVATWIDRHRSRHALYSMDARMLRDIGLSRFDVDGEIRKPFWRG